MRYSEKSKVEKLRSLLVELTNLYADEIACTRACHWYDELEATRFDLLKRVDEAVKND